MKQLIRTVAVFTILLTIISEKTLASGGSPTVLPLAEIKAYAAYLKQWATRYKVKEYLIAVSCKKKGINQNFVFSAFFDPGTLRKVMPDQFFDMDGNVVVVYRSADTPEKKHTGIVDSIYTKYFPELLKDRKRPVKSSTESIQIIDSDDLPDIPSVLPKNWYLVVRQNKIISKKIDPFELHTQ